MLIKSLEIQKQISDIRKQINNLPKGKLVCARNGTYYKWYRSTGKKNIYISKKNRHLAQQLAWKTYLSHLLEDKIKEKNAIQFYLNHYPIFPKTEKLLKNQEYRNLLEPHFKPLEEELVQWSCEPYERNPKYPEHLIHQSSSGNCVRSKSECMIDTMLYMKNIPFRYECALELGEIILYPDFTIRHPKTGKFYYWEHFGRMDVPEYAQNTFSKLQLYTVHGIIPSHQLITTYETKERPLSSDKIAKIIENYFM
ncbi:MAG: ATPase [Lachnospiraceae bacterium]|nr:ATPase [Lachnospiraceae bacterium]